MIAVFLDDIHHVQCDHYRNAQFHTLCSQIKVSLKVCRVHDIEDRVRLLLKEIISCYNFFKCIRRQGIDSGKVCYDDILLFLILTFFFFYCNARPVSHILCGTCKGVK